MSPSETTLHLAAVLMLVSAASLSAFGQRRQRYEGWHWWVGAAWLVAGGAVLGSLAVAGVFGLAGGWLAAATALAGLALLPWPTLMLTGLRRFHPRQALPGTPRGDAGVLVLGLLVVTAGLLPGLVPERLAPLLLLAGSALVPLHAAAVILLGPSSREFTPARAQALVLVAVALLPLLAAALAFVAGNAALAPLSARTLAAATGALVMAFMALTLVCERTERQLRDSRRRLRTLANVDALTQVPNRRHFQERAEAALQQDEPGTAVLVTLDVDRFKQINDLFGHAAGDRALCLVSTAMLECLRVHDVPGRQGGDEFVLLLRRMSPAAAINVAARIVAEVQRRAPAHQLPTLSLSFGVVQVHLGEGILSAMRRADQALYEAKRQGRSRAVAAVGDEDRPVFSESQRLGLRAA